MVHTESKAKFKNKKLEDDKEDQLILEEGLRDLGVKNAIKFFDEGQAALNYLYTTTHKPFIIFSDINLPGMDGFILRRQIQADDFLQDKAIPFIFLSTSATEEAVKEAYNLTVQGFFIKSNTMEQ